MTNPGLKKSIANRLQIARKNAGLSQGQVAKIMDMHRPAISEIEAARRKVSAEELIEFADIYKVSLNWLACKKEEKDKKVEKSLQLAARELANLKDEDLNSLIKILTAFKKS